MARAVVGIIIFLFIGCTSKTDFEPVFDVPAEFRSIIDTFIVEGEQRGFSFTINNLIVQYDESIPVSICGSSNVISRDPGIQKIISINPKICWVNDVQKEALIFHELGHCLLGREHDDSLLPNGEPKSMMVADDISLYSPCVYSFGDDDDCNYTFKRRYYLDELFDLDTPAPYWADE